MPDKWGIASRIRILRGVISQAKFAKKLGVSQAYISDLELMKKTPSVDFLLTLKKYYKVTIDWILEGDANGGVDIPTPGLPMIPIDQIRIVLENAEKSWVNGKSLDNKMTKV